MNLLLERWKMFQVRLFKLFVNAACTARRICFGWTMHERSEHPDQRENVL